LKGGDIVYKDFIEWFVALIRKDMEEYQQDQKKKKLLFGKIKGSMKILIKQNIIWLFNT
jgi:hypothetical protein